jgi:hypothetical protein
MSIGSVSKVCKTAAFVVASRSRQTRGAEMTKEAMENVRVLLSQDKD